jgi:ribose/xylose/arabinose/galactoside ABC-type transport system permease subunit
MRAARKTFGVEPSQVDRASTLGLSLRERILTSPQFLLGLVMVAFIAYGSTQSAAFLDWGTWINIFRDAVFILIAGSFTTFVLVSGGLDLSVGSVFMVGAMASAWLLQAGVPIPVAVGLGIACGGAAGLINGILVNYVRIPAFIATLGMLYVARGVMTFVIRGQPIAPLPDSFNVLGQGEVLTIPYLVIYAVVIAIVAHVVLEYTTFGSSVRAIGGNREAALNAGIKVRQVSVAVYVLSGVSAALAGVLMSARLGSGQPSVGNGFELQVISSVIIGGTSLFGGIGSVRGAALGAFVLSALTTGLILLRVDPVLENVMIGSIIIGAVALDQFRRGRMFRSIVRRPGQRGPEA